MRQGVQAPICEGEERMIEFRVVIIASLVTIFVSVFFIHFAFNSFIKVNETCATEVGPSCGSSGMLLLFVFCFSIVLAFIVVIESTVYYIFREVEMNIMMQVSGRPRRAERSLPELESRRDELKAAKRDAERKYFGREIAENTYDEMKKKYDKELMELEMEINRQKLRELEG
jgi:hypothetical protein